MCPHSTPYPYSEATASRYVNLADARFGARVLSVSDDFFAEASRMLRSEPPVFHAGRFDDHGQYMDGWESRRKRVAGHDWCIVKLGLPGRIVGTDIDTSHFTGNYPVSASLDACYVNEGEELDKWEEILHAENLDPNSHHFHGIQLGRVWTHVRLNIYPDGGIARLRIHGLVHPLEQTPGKEMDFLAIENGGRALAASDEHYGNPWALLRPGRGMNMGDGWETRRRRVPGNEWCLLALGRPTRVSLIVLDTAHYKGNYPDQCLIQAANETLDSTKSLITESMFWNVILPAQKMSMDAIHEYGKDQLIDIGLITHIRVNIIPDGGLSRVRVFGLPE